jgi:hypothetical protein
MKRKVLLIRAFMMLLVMLLIGPAIALAADNGDVTELIAVIGDVKARLIDLEENGKQTTMLNWTIKQAADGIKKVKVLLSTYEYKDKKQYQQIVADLEKRLNKVIIDL